MYVSFGSPSPVLEISPVAHQWMGLSRFWLRTTGFFLAYFLTTYSVRDERCFGDSWWPGIIVITIVRKKDEQDAR